MAVNLHKNEDDYNKKVATPGVNSGISTSGVTPAVPSPEPVPVGKSSDDTGDKIKGLAVEEGPKADPDANTETVEDLYAKLCAKDKQGKLTPEEKKLYEKLTAQFQAAQEKSEAIAQKDQGEAPKDKPKISEETKQKFKERIDEYKKLKSQGGTDYEKTSRILDKYLAENDENYQALKDKLSKTKAPKQIAEIEKQLRQKRNNIIHDWQAIVNPGIDNRNLSVKDRQRGIREIGEIFSFAGAAGKTGKELDGLTKPEVLKKILNISSKHELQRLEEVLNSIDFSNPNIDANTKLHQFAEGLLKNDPKYNSLQGEAKEEYLQNKVASTISDHLGMKITKEDMQNNKRIGLLKKIMVDIAAKAKKDNINLEEFLKDETKVRNAILSNMKQFETQIKELPEDEQQDAMRFITHLEISRELNNPNATERDIYAHLKTKAKNGEITDPQKDLLKYLDSINEKNPALLNQTIDLNSAVSMSIILGEKVDKIGKRYSAYINDGKTRQERATRLNDTCDKFSGVGKGATVFNTILDDIGNTYGKEELEAMLKNPRLRGKILNLVSRANITLDSQKPDSCTNAANGHLIMAKMGKLTKEESETYKASINNWKKDDYIRMGQEQGYRVAIKQSQSLRDANTQVVLGNFSNTEIKSIQAANIKTGDKDFCSSYSSALIKNASPQRQATLGKSLLELHDTATTEGVAAAEKFVDASVKEAYSQNLNNEINSGHYTEEQKANFQTARETGQTSYERTQASEGAKSNSSEHSVSNQQSNDAGSTQTVYSTGSKSSSINVSPQTQSIARETKTLIALNSQLNSENKKAEAMKKAADNIAKIQKDAIEREDSKAKQQEIKLQKQKLEEAKKENEKKSEEQLKAELSKVVDASIQEVQNELPQSAEGAVARQMLGDMYKNLKSYAQAGQLNQVYELLAKIPKAQELFIEKLATKHISVISHFIKTADKSVIRQLCELNPALISVLDKNTLLSIGIDKAKIIKYGDKDQIAGMLSDLQMASTKDTLNEFYEVMGIKNDEKDIEVASDALKKNDSTVDGGDDHMAKLLENMKRASSDIASSGVQGTVVPNWKEPGKKVPRELWG